MLLEALKKSGILNDESGYKRINASSGFTIIDFLNSELEYNKDFNTVLNAGFTNKFSMWCGESATGKTTMVIQLLAGAVEWWNRKYPEKDAAQLIMIDVEDNTELTRVLSITGWTPEYLRNHFSLQKMVDITEIYNLIVNVAHEKEKYKDKYMVETDIIDIDGKPVKSWITTYIIIDSISALKSSAGLENLDKNREGDLKYIDQISGNIDAMREAKQNVDFILKIKPILNKYGICLVSINHIVQEPQMSMYEPLKKYLPMLKSGQKIKGGKELVYQASSIGYLNPKEKLNEKNPSYGDNIYGIISEFSFVKSKMSVEGIGYRMIFDSITGYKPELSDFEYLQNTSYGLEGSPVKLYLTVLPEITFSRKTLYETTRKNPLLSRAIQFEAKIKMAHDLLLRHEAPKLTAIAQLPYETRIALILSYTYPYPGGSGDDLSVEVLNSFLQGLKNINGENVDLHMSYMDETNIWLMDSAVDGLSLLPILKIDRTIYDNPTDFVIEKDKDTGKEFWFKKELL